MKPRSLPENFSIKLRTSGIITLILITEFGDISFENTATGKDKLMESYNPDADTMLMAWTGQYKTDIFELTPEDLKTFYR